MQRIFVQNSLQFLKSQLDPTDWIWFTQDEVLSSVVLFLKNSIYSQVTSYMHLICACSSMCAHQCVWECSSSSCSGNFTYLQNNVLFFSPTSESSVSVSFRRLDANHISFVPSNCFSGLVSLRHLWLDDNSLTDIPVQAFKSLPALQAMTLALNKIRHIPDYAFGNLSSLVVL